jgi:glycosyltransferase involved in cell wall biosynthesis
VVAPFTGRSIGWAQALQKTCEAAWPEVAVHVLGAGRRPAELDGARVWTVGEINGTATPITGILTEADQIAWATPRLVTRLLADYDVCAIVPTDALIVAPATVLADLATRHGAAIATPGSVTPVHSLTPALGRLASRPFALRPLGDLPPDRLHTLPDDHWHRLMSPPEPRVLAISAAGQSFVDDWTVTVTEAVYDIDQRAVSWAAELFIDQAIGRADTVVESEHTLLHWSNYAAVGSGRADGPGAAIVDCDTLFAGARGGLETDDPEVAWSLLVHRVHDSRPVVGLMSLIAQSDRAQPHRKEMYFDTVRAQIRRAIDPVGHRWGVDDDDAFTDWLFETNEANCTRIAHLACIVDDELFGRFPKVRHDPSRFRSWVTSGGRSELGFDPFDRNAVVTDPVRPSLDASNPIAWRWTLLRQVAPGYRRRLARRESISFLGPDPAERRGIAPPVHVPVERVTPMWGSSPRSVNLVGPFRSESGLGQATRSSLAAFRHLGMPFTHIDPTEKYPSRNAVDVGLGDETHGLLGDVSFIHTNADEMLTMRWSAYKHRIGGHFTAAMWFWEPADLPHRSRGAFHLVDELWVASRYQQAVFGQYGRVPVHVVGLAAELPQARTVDRRRFGWGDDELVFLFVYDALSSYGRKNPRKALDAFISAFAPDFTGVRFILKVSNLNKFPASEREMRALTERHPAIAIIDEYMSRDDVLDLMAAADVSLSMHAAEGFGLTLLESMALGTPVIATGYSGNMDFTTEDNSWLIDYDMIAIDRRTGPYPAGSVWASPRLDTAVDLLRHVADNRAEIDTKAARAIIDARETASVERYAARLKEQLDRVL